MVSSNEDLEGYLRKLDRRFELTDDGTYLVGMGLGHPPVAVRLAPPVVLAQLRIGEVPTTGDVTPLLRMLLEFNATHLMHAAYGLRGETVILTAALQQDGLDLNELEAALADLDLALDEQVPKLRQLVKKKG